MAEFVPVSSKRQRLTFGRARDLVEIPDMIEVQRDSYNWFYQESREADMRTRQGLQELLQEVFPIESYDGSFALEFVRYILDDPSTEEEEARQRDLTWSRPVRATIRLVNRKTRELKEEEIFLGDFPIMTGRGTFVINGTERVVVNQLARSAGIYFTKDEMIPGQEAYSAKIIPERGAWLEFALSHGEPITVNIDNRKKIPATLLLKIFGAGSNEGVLELFNARTVEKDVSEDDVRGLLSAESVLDPDGGVILPRNRLITKDHLEALWDMGRTKVRVWDADPALSHPVVGTVAGLTADGSPDPTMYVMGRQAHFIEAGVDTDTGMVDITRIVCVNDVGHLFNPRGAQAQQYGGAVMGLGRSATEEQIWCPRTGVGLNFDLVQYHIGTMNDYPPAECHVTESHLGYAAFGAFGVGENVGAAMSGITASAIYNATGKWVTDYPTTPDRVLRALGRI